MSTPGRVFPAVSVPHPVGADADARAGIRWEAPTTASLAEMDENAAHSRPASLSAVTPGRSILKTPGRERITPGPAKTPGATKRWNNNPNANGRVTSPPCVVVSCGNNNNDNPKTPAATRTPGRRPSALSALAANRTPGGARTPGAPPRTPGGTIQAPAARVELKPKTPRRTHHHQMIISRPRTPGASCSYAEADSGAANPAAVLKTLPNATKAAYWLRRAERSERAGDLEEALGFLEQGIKRRAEPEAELVAARDALAAKLAADRGAASEAAEFAAMEAEAARPTPTKPNGGFSFQATTTKGSVVVVTPVRASPATREALACGEEVLTPARRSARVSPPERAAAERGGVATEAMLETTGYAYVPNDALKRSTTTPRRRVGAPLETARGEEAFGRSNPESRFAEALGDAKTLADEAEATIARAGGKVEVGSPAPARVVVDGVSPGRATATATPRVRHIACADRTPARAGPASPAALSVMTRASYGGVTVSASPAAKALAETLSAEKRRVAEDEAHAASEAAAAMLARQNSALASTPTNASPRRKPPRSPAPTSGKKASALARAASNAAEEAERTLAAGWDADAAGEKAQAQARSSASPAAFPSPGKAARERGESLGEDFVDAVADAVADAAPGSVETRRRRARRESVSVHTPPPPGEDEGEGTGSSPLRAGASATDFFTAADVLSAVTPLAPNAARRIATPGKGKSTSPLSVFARMMAKVIVETEAKTPGRAEGGGEDREGGAGAAAAARAALAETPAK